jgi:hypothetical protein
MSHWHTAADQSLLHVCTGTPHSGSGRQTRPVANPPSSKPPTHRLALCEHIAPSILVQVYSKAVAQHIGVPRTKTTLRNSQHLHITAHTLGRGCHKHAVVRAGQMHSTPNKAANTWGALRMGACTLSGTGKTITNNAQACRTALHGLSGSPAGPNHRRKRTAPSASKPEGWGMPPGNGGVVAGTLGDITVSV